MVAQIANCYLSHPNTVSRVIRVVGLPVAAD
jgi:hypothetical protein